MLTVACSVWCASRLLLCNCMPRRTWGPGWVRTITAEAEQAIFEAIEQRILLTSCAVQLGSTTVGTEPLRLRLTKALCCVWASKLQTHGGRRRRLLRQRQRL